MERLQSAFNKLLHVHEDKESEKYEDNIGGGYLRCSRGENEEEDKIVVTILTFQIPGDSYVWSRFSYGT